MRVIKRNLKGREGEITLLPESLDDLWHLKFLVERGDLVYAQTLRKVESATDKIRPESVEKKPVRLGIRVEKVEFQKFSNRLRIHGVIEDGIDSGAHHTLNIEPGRDLSIIKSWKDHQLRRIEEAVRASKRPRVIILTVEEGYATIGILRDYGVDEFAEIVGSSGKGAGGTRREFFLQIIKQLEVVGKEAESIIIAGPGFVKEELLRTVEEVAPELKEKSFLVDTSSTGVSGYQEVLRRKSIEKIVSDMRLVKESELFEELMREIAKGGNVAYGLEEVKEAVELGAVETLLITDEMAMTEEGEKLIRGTEQKGGRYLVFSTEFEPGKRLQHLGGAAAFLRFRISGE
ncbi:MAG: mRNA surveillance protein pelota [Archaeoglobi archaeon]|nr:mRNA surveillance protein pelota [Candidatus Mnemosynella bozhongmuii]